MSTTSGGVSTSRAACRSTTASRATLSKPFPFLTTNSPMHGKRTAGAISLSHLHSIASRRQSTTYTHATATLSPHTHHTLSTSSALSPPNRMDADEKDTGKRAVGSTATGKAQTLVNFLGDFGGYIIFSVKRRFFALSIPPEK